MLRQRMDLSHGMVEELFVAWPKKQNNWQPLLPREPSISNLTCSDFPWNMICQHIIELRLLGFKLVWLAARIWNQYNSHFTGKLVQLHKALYQDIETRFSHYYTLRYTITIAEIEGWKLFMVWHWSCSGLLAGELQNYRPLFDSIPLSAPVSNLPLQNTDRINIYI
jgi:hypothetical protein